MGRIMCRGEGRSPQLVRRHVGRERGMYLGWEAFCSDVFLLMFRLGVKTLGGISLGGRQEGGDDFTLGQIG